jgi:dihydroflavonol-4-reductase
MRIFVTGGTGFIGGSVVRCLRAAGHEVRALVRAGADTRQLDGLSVQRVAGDLRDADSLRRGIAGCDWVFHVAALDMISDYKRSKFLAEEVALDFARRGLPLVIVNPSTPVGVGDHKPTPTGKIIVDFLNGRMPAYVDTGLNVVDVEDVAAGHLLAAERGRVAERYILGGENLTLKQVLDILADISGRPPVRIRIPYGVALAWSYVDVNLARLNPRHTPSATPETVCLSHKHMYFDPSKAVRELGLPQTPARKALHKAVEWYRVHGYTS